MKKMIKKFIKFVNKLFKRNDSNITISNVKNSNISISTPTEEIKLEPIKMGAGKSSYDLYKSERDKRLEALGVPELIKEANKEGGEFSRLEELGIESQASDLEKDYFYQYLKGQSSEIVAVMRAVDQKHITKSRKKRK
jgi:hypothetical protein